MLPGSSWTACRGGVLVPSPGGKNCHCVLTDFGEDPLCGLGSSWAFGDRGVLGGLSPGYVGSVWLSCCVARRAFFLRRMAAYPIAHNDAAPTIAPTATPAVAPAERLDDCALSASSYLRLNRWSVIIVTLVEVGVMAGAKVAEGIV